MAAQAPAKMRPIVDARLKPGALPKSIITAFAADSTLSPEERTAAQAALLSHLDEQRRAARALASQANTLNTVAWNAVRFAPVAADVAAQALAEARVALELVPENPDMLKTLGVALYRAGTFAEAIEALTRSDTLYVKGGEGQQPADWAFVAMAHWQLGQKDKARAALATLEKLCADARWANDAESQQLFAEAQELITSNP
jgi:tetratricopeptide (TPR) repeat protein